MFESASTYSAWAPSYSASSVSSCGATVISVRLSDRTWSSSSVGSSAGSGFIGSVGGGKSGGSSSGGAFSSYSGTGSFVDMHRSNVTFDNVPLADKAISAYVADGAGRPGGGASGQLDPDFASPVGDVLLPMMLMVGVYAVVRIVKDWKRKVCQRTKGDTV